MDFGDTQDEAAFRAEARAFLEANAERRKPGAVEGYRRGQDAPGAVERAQAFQARKAAAGFAGITWPTEWGGRGGTQMQQIIYQQEEAKFDVLTGIFSIGLGMCIPTICTCGTPEQRNRFTGPALRGEEIWCQLFSEPAGGSDLAALRTRAERDGDSWVINGQKIWTSGAHYSRFGILVARSDPNVPKHAGLTFFILDMKTPGVTIRPIRQLTGSSHFNEVFFDNVRIPDSMRVGAVGNGWRVALTTLMNERHGMREAPGPDFDEAFELARLVELEDGPALDNAAVQE
ncbi:MAG: acyl-CoA dehydrogenase family protein, partial [Acetobacteraceae bacterium]